MLHCLFLPLHYLDHPVLIRSISITRWKNFVWAELDEAGIEEKVKLFASFVALLKQEGGCTDFPVLYAVHGGGKKVEVHTESRRNGTTMAYVSLHRNLIQMISCESLK